MSLLKIARLGHPVLRRKAAPIADPTDPELRRITRDMAETMEDAGGVGLAGPQIYLPLRVIVFKVPAERTGGAAGDAAEGLQVLLNPEITPLDAATEVGWEGCLSIPGLRGAVPRHTRIGYRGLDLDGRTVAREATGFHARVVQHECDHLDGVVYLDRMPDLRYLAFNEELPGFRAPQDDDP